MKNRIDTVERACELARERNMTPSELAKACGMNHSTLGTTKKRGGQMQVESIIRVCDVLEITLREFFTVS